MKSGLRSNQTINIILLFLSYWIIPTFFFFFHSKEISRMEILSATYHPYDSYGILTREAFVNDISRDTTSPSLVGSSFNAQIIEWA